MQTTFKRGHKFDFLDMFTITPKEVQELFWKELWSKVDKNKPNLDNLKVMLESGLVDLEAEDDEGYKPLYWAIEYNSLEVAQLLISSGVDLEAKDSWGQTPLHWAVGYDRLEIVQFLISSGADVNVKDKWNQTPLYVGGASKKLVELLIKHGATR